MFKFFQRKRDSAILAECEQELRRTAAAHPGYVSVPRDMNARAELLRRAVGTGLGEHTTVKRLEFLQRLVHGVTADPALPQAVLESLLIEAARYQFDNIQAVRLLREYLELERLKREGPRAMAHDSQGRAIYCRCAAMFKNRDGQLDVRDDGISFSGEVVIEIRWSDVKHTAKTTHTYKGVDYTALALQEGKRRTPTLFALILNGEAAYACEVVLQLWEQNKTQRKRV
jgi:hypothetical protein